MEIKRFGNIEGKTMMLHTLNHLSAAARCCSIISEKNIMWKTATIATTVCINRAFKQLYQHTDDGKSESEPLVTLSTR